MAHSARVPTLAHKHWEASDLPLFIPGSFIGSIIPVTNPASSQLRILLINSDRKDESAVIVLLRLLI